MGAIRWSFTRQWATRLSLLVTVGAFAVVLGTGTASAYTTGPLGSYAPTYVGTADQGCASGCSLLSGPNRTSLTSRSSQPVRGAASARDRSHSMPSLNPAGPGSAIAAGGVPLVVGTPTVNCPGLGCDNVNTSSGGATGVKGLNDVDSSEHTANIYKDVEPPDQGLCAGNGYVVETNNIGEMLVFDTALHRMSAPISLDAVMGLAGLGWSSGGDPSCEYDPSNGGHFFITEIVSASTEASGGAFTGCFAAVSNECYEGIAVSQGANPLGPYYTYYAAADYNPAEPGYPKLLNDFAKIGMTRDAFLMFYDEFPLLGGFNGAQQIAFDKTALETGQPASSVGVAIMNMGSIPTPSGDCSTSGGVDCWATQIPAQPADSGQWDNTHGGTGFIVGQLDFNSFAGNPTPGDNQIAVWDWTGLSDLNSSGCSACSGISFTGTLFMGVDEYNDPETPPTFDGFLTPQKAGPIPLGSECGAAGLSNQSSCPENGIQTNGDNMFEISQAGGQLWAPLTTEVSQSFAHSTETHQGVVYYVIGTRPFDSGGGLTLNGQGYISAAHEDLIMPGIAAEGSGGVGGAVWLATLAGNGGPNGADNGGFYPSTAWGKLARSSNGLIGSTMYIADMGQSPQDGFSEYQGYTGGSYIAQTRPRWGDYTWGIYLPGGSDRIYFANEYIQSPNCTGSAFTLTIGTCGGTRNGNANWGTSVNYVVP